MTKLSSFEILKLTKTLNSLPICMYFRILNWGPNIFLLLLVGLVINSFFEIKMTVKKRKKLDLYKLDFESIVLIQETKQTAIKSFFRNE
jgi:hypothetical protein